MKTPIVIYTAILALSIVGCLHAEESKAYVAETSEITETFRTRILKIHQFVEGDFEYTAYAVSWRGHEVILPAPMGGPTLKEGDEIRCVMKSGAFKIGGTKRGWMSFSIISSPASADDEARLRAVAAEVNRRRAERAKDEAKTEK